MSADILPAHAAFAEPLSCSLQVTERAQITFEDTVVAAGRGPIGLGMVAGAAGQEPDARHRPRHGAGEAGTGQAVRADVTINIAEEDVEAIVKGLTDGYGADVYLEGTGHPLAVPQGLNALRKLGRYVEYGCSAVTSPSTGASSATTRNSTSSVLTWARTAGPRRSR